MYIALLVGFCCTFIRGIHNFIIEKDYHDTIKYHDYCVSHYRESRKAPSLSPNLVQHREVKESIVTVCNI